MVQLTSAWTKADQSGCSSISNVRAILSTEVNFKEDLDARHQNFYQNKKFYQMLYFLVRNS